MGLVYLSYALTANMSDGFHNAFIAFALCTAAFRFSLFLSISVSLCLFLFSHISIPFYPMLHRYCDFVIYPFLLYRVFAILLLISCFSLTLFFRSLSMFSIWIQSIWVKCFSWFLCETSVDDLDTFVTARGRLFVCGVCVCDQITHIPSIGDQVYCRMNTAHQSSKPIFDKFIHHVTLSAQYS